jgi:hypothetical protein
MRSRITQGKIKVEFMQFEVTFPIVGGERASCLASQAKWTDETHLLCNFR